MRGGRTTHTRTHTFPRHQKLLNVKVLGIRARRPRVEKAVIKLTAVECVRSGRHCSRAPARRSLAPPLSPYNPTSNYSPFYSIVVVIFTSEHFLPRSLRRPHTTTFLVSCNQGFGGHSQLRLPQCSGFTTSGMTLITT